MDYTLTKGVVGNLKQLHFLQMIDTVTLPSQMVFKWGKIEKSFQIRKKIKMEKIIGDSFSLYLAKHALYLLVLFSKQI